MTRLNDILDSIPVLDGFPRPDWAPVDASGFYHRALLHQERREYDKAAGDFQLLLEKGSEVPEHLNRFAWLLCTCPADSVRHGQKAVELATRACELTDWKSEAILDTLAAAHAESGSFEDAVKWARRAVDLAEVEQRHGDEMRLRLYEQRQTVQGSSFVTAGNDTARRCQGTGE